LDLYFTDWALVPRFDLSLLPDTSASARRVPSGTPVLVDDAMRPVEPWCTFLRLYCQNLSRHSIHAYARDALEFGRFLAARGVGVLDVSEADLVAYRTERLDSGISPRSWARQLVVVRALFTFLFETGRRDTCRGSRWGADQWSPRGYRRLRWTFGRSRELSGLQCAPR
jgi:Phage integrase, N-terminal SAM-like domain